MLGSGGGGGAAGTHSWLRSAQHQSCPGERVCCVSLCHIFSLSVSLLFLFPLFAVLLNCPYPNPPVFLPVSFHSPPHRGGGRGGRVALLLPAAAETKTASKSTTVSYIFCLKAYVHELCLLSKSLRTGYLIHLFLGTSYILSI